jgi:hypothetical protein
MIQAAIDAQHAANCGTVYLPASVYVVTTLQYYSNTIIKGAGIGPSGAGGTTLFQLSGTAAAILTPNANRMSGMLFEDFTVYGGGNTSNAGGLDLTGATDFVVRRVTASTCKLWNIRMLGGTTGGDAGFATFETVLNANAVDDAWQIGSSTNDQPDGLNFTNCRTITSGTATAIHYLCTSGRPGPGSGTWTGCTFEIGPNAITVDAAGAGMNEFINCRFENTSAGGLTFTLYGFGIQPFAFFHGGTLAPGGGTLTWTDNGPVMSERWGQLIGDTSQAVLHRLGQAMQDRSVALTSGTAPALDAKLGDHFTLTITSNIAVVIAVPSNRPAAGFSQDIAITIRNGSGGALSTAPTFNTGANGFKFSTVTNPANGTQVTYRFRWDPVQSFWYEVGTHQAAGL